MRDIKTIPIIFGIILLVLIISFGVNRINDSLVLTEKYGESAIIEKVNSIKSNNVYRVYTGKEEYLVRVDGKKVIVIIDNNTKVLAQEFIEKGLKILNNGGKMAMFLKIQFLEGVKRIDMFKKYPPKYIYVFSKRMATWNNGEQFDQNGKRWATTMCHAWFIWEKEFIGEPIVRWL